MGATLLRAKLSRFVNGSIDLGFEHCCTCNSLERNLLRLFEEARCTLAREENYEELFSFSTDAFQVLEGLGGEMPDDSVRVLGRALMDIWEEVYAHPSRSLSHTCLREKIQRLSGEEKSPLQKEARGFLDSHAWEE